MKVVVFAPYAINTPHFETDLEIIQNHLDQADDVTLLGCDGELSACDVNPRHKFSVCHRCRARRPAGLELLKGHVSTRSFHRLTDEDLAEQKRLQTRFAGLDELREYRVENFDIGYAVLSSLVSRVRDPDVDLADYRGYVERMIQASWSVYRSMRRYLGSNGVDRVYLFNGRHGPLRAALRACQAESVDCLTHDKAHDLRHYALFENTMPHDREYLIGRIKEAWNSAGPESRRAEIAERWYHERSEKICRTWISYVKDQEAKRLPANWDPRRRNIAVFPSSEDEMVAIGDFWKNPLYETQLDGLRAIIESLRQDPGDLHLYVRMHPNLAGRVTRQTREYAKVNQSFVTLIAPDDPVCTYTLMREAEKVFTFGSTAGIEAVFWGIPSVLAGMSSYRELGETYICKSHPQTIELLRAHLEPQDKTAALVFGHFFATFGNRFRYYDAEGIFEGKFRGTRIAPSLLDRLKIHGMRALDRLAAFNDARAA